MRSWLLPLLFAGPLELGEQLAPGTGLGVLLARLVCVAIAMGGVVAIAGLGWRLSRAHGMVAGFAAAIWFELAYFAPRTLSEPVATALLLGAGALLAVRDIRSARWAGLLLGLAVAVRLQYAPAALVLAAGMTPLDRRHWLNLAAGGAVALAISATAELIMGSVPLAWAWHNIHQNLVEGRAAGFGVSPPWWYLESLWQLWGPAFPLILLLAAVGARRYPALFAAALVNLAVHSLIGHKEYRFILLTTAILVALAAIGSVDVLRNRLRSGRSVAQLCGAWLLLSLACLLLGSATRQWGSSGELMSAWRTAGTVPGGCGVAMYRSHLNISTSQLLLGRDWPLYEYDAASAGAAQTSAAFNVLIAPARHAGELPAFRQLACADRRKQRFCVYVRPGTCHAISADAPHAIQSFLRRHDR
ncbi:hypothetical protein BFL28_17020 [Sphingomonas turrisvirgatae]|uniref:Mannosyltransferase n=2 Tax=Sphingomonas turrisvirgatae TaxID=1888892 RepID=A0A1E3LV02_9SPHN|nr:hypothetical protein BFL28_17020 [Sphingomonas turrisvirgatae]